MTISRWAIIEGHYWFYVHYHRGQSSWEYMRMCRISKYYKPSVLWHDGPQDEDAIMVYDKLVAAHVKFYNGNRKGSRRTIE